MLPWVTRTALGLAVVPDVNISTASSSSCTGWGVKELLDLSVAAAAQPRSASFGLAIDVSSATCRAPEMAVACVRDNPEPTMKHVQSTKPALRRLSCGVSVVANGTATCPACRMARYAATQKSEFLLSSPIRALGGRCHVAIVSARAAVARRSAAYVCRPVRSMIARSSGRPSPRRYALTLTCGGGIAAPRRERTQLFKSA